MISVISGTNRKGSLTSLFAKYCFNYLQENANEEVHFINLEDIPSDMYNENMYSPDGQSEGIKEIQNKSLLPAEKLLFVFPEYNGSYPGALKVFIDACSIRLLKETWKGKKAGLIGIATGRAGNLRGMDQLTEVLNHLGTTTLANKLPISKIKEVLADGQISDQNTLDVIQQQCNDLIAM